MFWKWSIAILLLLAAAASIGYGLFGRGANDGRSLPAPESKEAEALDLFVQQPIGQQFEKPPKISYVEILDLDQDGIQDVLVCDCTNDFVSWIRQDANGEFQELILCDELTAPARFECRDFDQDGDLDLFVAVLGKLFPSDEKVGSLVFLENDGEQNFTKQVLLDGVPRISDVRSGDLDGDQDLDLVVTQFGYYEGQIQWLENVNGQWKPHVLQSQAGGIHGILCDMNDDGNADIVALVSQEVEAIYQFLGNGKGDFREEEIYPANNPDFGSAGIWVEDLDQDGDQDVLYCNGDAFDYSPPRPWPWHGIQWLENRSGSFRYHRLADFGGAVNATCADYDLDGDLDVFVCSAFNAWDSPNSQSLRVLENAGSMKFRSHPLGNSPSHIQALDSGDLNGDGRLDLVTGGMHISEPYDRVGRIVAWFGTESLPAADASVAPFNRTSPNRARNGF